MTDTSASGRPRPGRTAVFAGRAVARLGYGAMQLGEHPNRGPVDRSDAVALLRQAVTWGVDHLDTASFYSGGFVNEVIREALAPHLDDVVVVSKVGAAHRPGTDLGLVAAQKPAQLRAGVEDDLRTLGVERVDVVNLRRVDTPPGIVAAGDQVVDLDDQLAEMVALREEGKIGAIGLSNVDLDQVRRALPAGVACVQNAYSLLDRSAEPLLALCAEHEIAWVPFWPLGSAFDRIASVADDPVVTAAAERLGVTPSQVGLAWLLAHDRHVLLIPGTTSVGHLAENLAVGDVVLDPGTTALLDARDGVAGRSSAFTA